MSLFQIFFYAVLALVVILAAVYWRKVQGFGLLIQKTLREIRVEMQKVSWPSRDNVIGSTIVVLTAVVVLTLIIVVTDEALAQIIRVVLPGGEGA